MQRLFFVACSSLCVWRVLAFYASSISPLLVHPLLLAVPFLSHWSLASPDCEFMIIFIDGKDVVDAALR